MQWANSHLWWLNPSLHPRLPILIDQWTSLALYPWYANLKRKIPITSHRSTLNQYESAINPSKLCVSYDFFFWVKSTISYDFQCFPYGFVTVLLLWSPFSDGFPRWAPQPTFLVRTTCAVPPVGAPPAEGEDPQVRHPSVRRRRGASARRRCGQLRKGGRWQADFHGIIHGWLVVNSG